MQRGKDERDMPIQSTFALLIQAPLCPFAQPERCPDKTSNGSKTFEVHCFDFVHF